jgi:hypothetical protein
MKRRGFIKAAIGAAVGLVAPKLVAKPAVAARSVRMQGLCDYNGTTIADANPRPGIGQARVYYVKKSARNYVNPYFYREDDSA